VVRSPLRGNRVGSIMAILFAVWIIYWIVQFRNWTTRAEIIAFFAGGGGMMVMFYRWRRHGDRLAKVLCLAAFGTWCLAVITWGVGGADAGKPGSLGFDVAAAALLTGFVGAIVVLVRLYTHRDWDTNAQPQ
jgi:peptidoglycan/LPS O-acetylase OafA/YrhL